MDDTNNDTTGDVDTSVDTTVDAVTDTILNDEVATTGNEFLDGLDVKYRNDPNLKKFDSVDKVLDSYNNLSKMIGKDKVVLPTGEGEEYEAQMNELFNKLGRPETADGYGIEDIDLNEDGINAVLETGEYKEVAHKLGLTPTQAKGVLDYYKNDVVAKNSQAAGQIQEQVNESRTELRKEYGAKYEEHMQAANGLFKEYFPSLQGTELTRNPAFVRELVNLSKNFSETKLGDSPTSSTRTPSEAKAEKASLMQSAEYNDIMSPGYKAAQDRYFALLEMEAAGRLLLSKLNADTLVYWTCEMKNTSPSNGQAFLEQIKIK